MGIVWNWKHRRSKMTKEQSEDAQSGEWIMQEVKNQEYKWKYCGNCDVMMVICPECGNNCCNGGGDKCCSPAYAYQRIMNLSGQQPEKPKNWKEIKEKAQNFLKTTFE